MVQPIWKAISKSSTLGDDENENDDVVTRDEVEEKKRMKMKKEEEVKVKDDDDNEEEDEEEEDEDEEDVEDDEDEDEEDEDEEEEEEDEETVAVAEVVAEEVAEVLVHELKSPMEDNPISKEKLRSIMAAASALTALGDDDDDDDVEEVQKALQTTKRIPSDMEDSEARRFIPGHKKPDSALTFPEKLMSMMRMAERQENPDTFCVAWLPDGKSFVIRNTDEFTRTVLPHYFKATKFSSYTRKLYRWGFRQVNRGIGPDDPIIFGNEYFQRDNAELMTKMRSITAAGTRKAASSSSNSVSTNNHTTSSSSGSSSSYVSSSNNSNHPIGLNTNTNIGLPPPPPSHKERIMMMEAAAAAAAAAAVASNNALSQSILFPSTSSILKRSLDTTSNPSFQLEQEQNYRKRILLEHMMLHHYNHPKRNLQAAAAAAAVAAASSSSLHPMNLNPTTTNTAAAAATMGSLGSLCHTQRSLLNLSTPALSNLYAAAASTSNPLNFLLASNHHHHHPSSHHLPTSSLSGLLSSNSPYNPNSTADIVNAAINALRFAS